MITAMTGSRTPVSRVTGGDNHRYTITTLQSEWLWVICDGHDKRNI